MSPETKQRVLIVDDDVDLIDMLRITLTSAGFDVVAALSGTEALEWLADNTPDAIVLDIMMPDIDGFGVLRSVRADERTGQKPVIMLSSRVDLAAKEQSQREGADAYFTKPTPLMKLIEELREQMERRGTGEIG
ncbi:MAG: response regulator transcription factor [Anaerolineales bacterium]